MMLGMNLGLHNMKRFVTGTGMTRYGRRHTLRTYSSSLVAAASKLGDVTSSGGAEKSEWESTGTGNKDHISSLSASSFTSKSQPPLYPDRPSLTNAFDTVDNMLLCGAYVVVVQSPTPDVFQPSPDPNMRYSHTLDDVRTEEVRFGRDRERNNKSRLNMFMGGRIALRRAFKTAIQRHEMNENYDDRDIDTNRHSKHYNNIHKLRKLRALFASDLSYEVSLSHYDDLIPPILKDEWGAPMLPPWSTGSISNKDDLAVAAVNVDDIGRVGVDLEHTNNKAAMLLARRILTADERERLGRLKDVTAEEEVILRFSFKEAIYKAIHPFMLRSIDFEEVEVDPSDDGTAKITCKLKSGEQFDFISSWMRYRDKYWLTCAYCTDPSGKMPKYR
jgi:phosphopantetheine--protein transferase-like protein